LDITFRFDGEKCALALDRDGYDMSYLIVILNKDGSYHGAFRENTLNAKGKINITGMIYDNLGFITLGLDFAPDGTAAKRQAILTRFNVATTPTTLITPVFYQGGGATSGNFIS